MKLRTVLKPVAFALLIVFLPTAAVAQNPAATAKPASSRTKMKWIALGSVIGGAGLALVGAMSGKDTTTAGTAYSPTSSSCTSVVATVSTTVSSSACTLTGLVPAAIVAVIIPTIPGPPSQPATPPGTIVAPMFGTPTSVVSLSMSQGHGRGPNWKMIVPAIGAASVGTFVLYRDHARTKRAELSVRPDGTAQLAFKW